MLLTAAYRLHLVERRLRDTSNRKPISPLYCPESGAYVHHAHDLKRMSASLSFEIRKKLTKAAEMVQSSRPQLFVLSLAQMRTRYMRAVHTKNNAIAELSHGPRLSAMLELLLRSWRAK
jgi:hypothetical protein